MRNLVHLGIFIVALTAVTQADAQGRYRAEAHGRVVRVATAPVVYDSHRPIVHQDRDASEIANIATQWRWAVARHDRRGQWVADQRLDAWLSREIRQSVRQPYDHRYAMRLRTLNNQLIALERQPHRGGQRGYYARKARVLDELVELSAWQTKRARGHHRSSIQLSFAAR